MWASDGDTADVLGPFTPLSPPTVSYVQRRADDGGGSIDHDDQHDAQDNGRGGGGADGGSAALTPHAAPAADDSDDGPEYQRLDEADRPIVHPDGAARLIVIG